MATIIKSQDIERVVSSMPENDSHARKYFDQVKMKNSTHVTAVEIQKEVGNIPVIVRGGTGVVPKHGVKASDVVPMPIEIDDRISAVQMDDWERATDMGKQQIIDEFLLEHANMVRQTTNALCCQAHKGSIDYMMQTASGLERYQVSYGTVATKNATGTLASLTYGGAVKFLQELQSEVAKNGVGGKGEFVAGGDVFAKFADLVAGANKTENIGDGFLVIGAFKVYQDNDVYTDTSATGTKTAKSLCAAKEIVYRANGGGQKLLYLRLDDVVQREAVPLYSFTEKALAQRGENIYTRSKPFPLVNLKAICWGVWAS